MKAFLAQALAVVLAGAGIGSVAAPWTVAPAVPQTVVSPQQAAGGCPPGCSCVSVNLPPLGGTVTLTPANVMPGFPMTFAANGKGWGAVYRYGSESQSLTISCGGDIGHLPLPVNYAGGPVGTPLQLIGGGNLMGGGWPGSVTVQ